MLRTPTHHRSALAACVLAVAWLAPALHAQTQPDPARASARQAPAWVRDGVVYEVFPRAFSPEGNFAGVTAQLDRLHDLGVTIVWLMPIHPQGQLKKKGTVGSPYAVRDYQAINPEYGNADDLRTLIAEAHDRGMKVVIDLVANHTAWDSVWMEHPEFYTRDDRGVIQPPNPDWSDIADLNYDNPDLRRAMIAAMTYWVREFDLDGYRCDVAMEVPTDFWEQARAALELVKPDLMMLAEASKPELLVEAFDLDYAWPFHGTLMDVIFNGRSATAIRDVWKQERAEFPRGSLHLRFSDNHDERRAIARFGERGALAASALVFTMDGVPLLYNGQEVGDTTESGAPALFERLPIFWQNADRRPEFPRFYRQLIALRHAHPALRQGQTVWVPNSDEERIVSYLRRAEGEEFLVVVNLSNRPFRGRVEVEAAGAFDDLTPDLGSDAPGPPQARPVAPAPPEVELGPWGFRILRRKG